MGASVSGIVKRGVPGSTRMGIASRLKNLEGDTMRCGLVRTIIKRRGHWNPHASLQYYIFYLAFSYSSSDSSTTFSSITRFGQGMIRSCKITFGTSIIFSLYWKKTREGCQFSCFRVKGLTLLYASCFNCLSFLLSTKLCVQDCYLVLRNLHYFFHYLDMWNFDYFFFNSDHHNCNN